MGFGGRGTPTEFQPTRPSIPHESGMLDIMGSRIGAASPWANSPWRAMDFLWGLPSSPIQIPQYPGNPQMWGGYFNPGYTTPGYANPITSYFTAGLNQLFQQQHYPMQTPQTNAQEYNFWPRSM